MSQKGDNNYMYNLSLSQHTCMLLALSSCLREWLPGSLALEHIVMEACHATSPPSC